MKSQPIPSRVLVLGGARSGKSRWAEDFVRSSGLRRVYIATAQARDEEMSERIALHKKRRGSGWRTIEAPLELCDALEDASSSDAVVLVDCLTLWLSNLMESERCLESEFDRLLALLRKPPGPVIMVSNEVGLGIVPTNKLAREFRDRAGHLNQKIALLADLVVFMAAGLPMALKAPDGWRLSQG